MGLNIQVSVNKERRVVIKFIKVILIFVDPYLNLIVKVVEFEILHRNKWRL